jgi:hypothetical protein
MARKFRHRKRRLTQFGHGARPTNALADSDVFCGEFRPFTIMPLTSKSRGGTVPFITAGALIMLGTALFFVLDSSAAVAAQVRPRLLAQLTMRAMMSARVPSLPG